MVQICVIATLLLTCVSAYMHQTCTLQFTVAADWRKLVIVYGSHLLMLTNIFACDAVRRHATTPSATLVLHSVACMLPISQPTEDVHCFDSFCCLL